MKSVIVIALALFSMNVYAKDTSSGCGIGWEIAPDQSLVSSSVRSVVDSMASNTVGMTLGTSGCAKHSIVENDKKDIHYAEVNFHEVMAEMSQGQGEHLKGFALAMGCANEEVNAFSQATQNNYGQIFNSSKVVPADLVQHTRHTMESAKVCSDNRI